MAPRPDSAGTTPIQEGRGNSSSGIIEAWRYKADMARWRVVEFFLGKSGDLANTTKLHRAMRSGLYAMHQSGFDSGPLIALLDEASRLSPDENGQSRKQALQLMEESPIVIPGVGSSYREPEQTGRVEHLKRAVMGEPKGGA